MKSFDPAAASRLLARLRIDPYWLVVILCGLFILPAIFIRGAHYEEGTAIALARSLFEDGLWPGTYRYGERFVDRPQGVSWILAAVGYVVGGLPVWLARVPTALSLLGGASLIYWLVRKSSSTVAALFAVVCFVASPMVLQRIVTAEPDIVVSVLLFAAFVLFWRGYTSGGPTVSRWLAIAAILAMAGLVKGPHPLGYYFLGVGAFLVLRRQWKNFFLLGGAGVLAGAALAAWYVTIYQPGDFAIWVAHSRLTPEPLVDWVLWSVRFCGYVLIENVPGILLFVPLAWIVFRRGAQKNDDLVVALILYAIVCTVPLAMWPGANGRYAMPATLAVAAGAGLAFDRFTAQRRLLVSTAMGVAILLVAYQLIINWILMPLVPDTFRQQAILGQRVAAMAQPSDALLVSSHAVEHNLLAYVPYHVRVVPYDVISKAKPPFWAIVLASELPALRKDHAASEINLHLVGSPDNQLDLVEVLPK